MFSDSGDFPVLNDHVKGYTDDEDDTPPTQETATIVPTQDTNIKEATQDNTYDDDSDDGDFTQNTSKRHSTERRIRAGEIFDAKLRDLHASGGAGKIKAGAYLTVVTL